MTAVEDRLAEIEARATAATPGPWKVHLLGFGIGRITDTKTDWTLIADVSQSNSWDFIAAARTDVPALAAALRAVLREADPGDLVIGAAGWVAGYQDAMSDVRACVAAALVVTP